LNQVFIHREQNLMENMLVENVISYYEPLIPPQKIGTHYFWTNFFVPQIKTESRKHQDGIEELQKRKGFYLSSFSGIDKVKTLRNSKMD